MPPPLQRGGPLDVPNPPLTGQRCDVRRRQKELQRLDLLHVPDTTPDDPRRDTPSHRGARRESSPVGDRLAERVNEENGTRFRDLDLMPDGKLSDRISRDHIDLGQHRLDGTGSTPAPSQRPQAVDHPAAPHVQFIERIGDATG